MLVEGQARPFGGRQARSTVPPSGDLIPITGLNYRPQTAGEKKITLRVKPKDGELVKSNNSISTYVTVLKGGLNVLFIQGPHSPWEHKYWMLSVASSPDIQAEERVVRSPARRGVGELNDDDFTPGRYDVYVLSDLPADFLSPAQQALLVMSVQKGGGLIMLGGRSSFGMGGWAATEVGQQVLPVTVSPRDGQIEPEQGIRFVPEKRAGDDYLLQIGSNPLESARLWGLLSPMSGINHLGEPKPGVTVFARS